MAQYNHADLVISGFADWVKQQTPAREYNYCSPCSCAFATYLHELGYESAVVGSRDFAWRASDPGPDILLPQAIASALCTQPFTYGALHQRLSHAHS